jgi:hypothetical protein
MAVNREGEERSVVHLMTVPGLGTLPRHPDSEKMGAYPGASSSEGLPKGFELHLLVMAHKLIQGAVAEGVS